MGTKLTLLIISDLHAHSGDPRASGAPSYYSTNSMFGPSGNPLKGVAALIKSTRTPVDWVVCPGDLGDKADPASQEAAWKELEAIRAEIGAAHLVGTAGNHDMDSRRVYPEFDPKSALQALVPTFPVALSRYQENDGVYADRFWSRNFAVAGIPEYDCTLAVINSSAFHGYASEAAAVSKEHLHGRISPLTLNALGQEIKDLKSTINIAILHHHPKTHPYINDGNSVMINGDKLIEVFKATGRQWLIIHGHQHVPHLQYADAHFFSPTVLSSGSAAAKTFPAMGKHPRNQIHLVEIDTGQLESDSRELRGKITSWTWVDILGWREGSSDAGMPYKAGFGYRANLTELARTISRQLDTKAERMLRYNDLLVLDPNIEHLIPDDQSALLELLRSQGVAAEFDSVGRLSILEKRP